MSVKKAGDQAIHRQSLYGTTSEATYAGALSFMRRKYTRDLNGVDLAVTGAPLSLPHFDARSDTWAGATVAMEMVCLYASASRVQADTASPPV